MAAPSDIDITTAGQQAAETRKPAARGIFEASVAATDSGPFMTLTGKARFAGVAAIRTLVLAASTLRRQGGRLVLLHPSRPWPKIVTLLGADQVFMLEGTGTTAEAGQQ